ncbi:O-acyltransferase [Bergeyella porcorum]|uniref:O-acyltransferase n=1 Tax=Bergeyella porcorum TaxID=1735111 RepID=A0AAU0F527_9FLAO
MLFNSIEFAIFLPIVFILYWFVFQKNLKLQNLFIVIVSYIFYGWWDWRFLFLIIFSTAQDYFLARMLINEENERKRKWILATSIITNLGFLGFFKYYNFFVDNFITAFTFFGMKPNIHTLQILLPVGISFYTFQTLSYTIDVYKRKMEATKDFVAFSAFVSFFPQLVAGPIERATHLLPQFYKKRVFNYELAKDGMRQILWGLFKKMVIADNCAVYANMIFNNYENYTGSTLAMGAILFAFQIYGDFSGYSDVAIGTSKLFGFDLMRNFSLPYFSRSVAEFWRKWHISLSTWFRDYLYFPLGGSKSGMTMQIRNTFIIFIVSGFWHGANWTFIIWGFLNALFILPSIIMKTNRNHIDIVAQGKIIPSIKEISQMLLTFFLITLSWIFFRAQSVTEAFEYIKKMFTTLHIGIGYPYKLLNGNLTLLFLLFLLLSLEWITRDKFHPFQFDEKKIKQPIRWSIYIVFSLLILWLAGEQEEFIYFQF